MTLKTSFRIPTVHLTAIIKLNLTSCFIPWVEVCGRCERGVDVIQRCPCDKKSLKEMGVTRKSCLDDIPTCEDICGKKLSCGQVAKNHTCQSKCHTGPCPPCPLTTKVMKLLFKSCRAIFVRFFSADFCAEFRGYWAYLSLGNWKLPCSILHVFQSREQFYLSLSSKSLFKLAFGVAVLVFKLNIAYESNVN